NTYITGGTWELVSGNGLGKGTVTLSNGATLNLNYIPVTNTIVTLSGTVLNMSGTATTTTVNGTTVFSSGTTGGSITVASTGNAIFNNTVNQATVTINAGGQASFNQQVTNLATINVSGSAAVASGMAGSLSVNSGGLVTFSGSNTGGSTFDVASGALAQITSLGTIGGGLHVSGSATIAGTVLAGGDVIVQSGGVVTLLDGAVFSQTSLTNSGALIVNRSTGNDLTLPTNIGSTGSLTKTGGAMLTLSGSNGFTGATTISQGAISFAAPSALAATSGINIAGGAGLTYTGGASTFSRNISVTSGTGTVTNSGGGLLTLAGTLTKNGTVLRLTGGAFNVTGQIVGANANSDLLIDGTSTVTLSTTNGYNGPTFVNQASTLIVGVNNAIPSTSTVTLGNATSKGTLELGTYTNPIGGLVFSGSGGTLKIAANQTSSAQLASSGGVTLGGNSTLDLAGMQSSAGLYKLVSASTISGSFGTVQNLNANYTLLTSSTSLDAQRKAEIGTITATPAAATIITGGSTAFTFTVQNSTPTGGASLNPTIAAGSNVAGSATMGSVAANSTSSAISGLVFTGTSVGTGQTGSFTVSDANAITTSALGSVSVNVLDHATPGFVGIDPALANLTLDFGTVDESEGQQSRFFALTNIASSFGTSLTAGLALTGFSHYSGDSLFSTTLSTFSNLQAGGTNSYTASFTPSGQGTFSEVFKLTFSDNQSLSGAAQRRDLFVTMNVIIVPEPAAVALAGIGIAMAGWSAWKRRR
ncbi:MAG: autotransporter-associated beta strand repeat-containing protein, partial [Planctomycetota bacterium]